MKVTQMPPIHAVNLVAKNGNTAYGVDVMQRLSLAGCIPRLIFGINHSIYISRPGRRSKWYLYTLKTGHGLRWTNFLARFEKHFINT